MKKTALKIIAIAFFVSLVLSLCSCNLAKELEKYMEEKNQIEDGWDFNHNGKIDEETEGTYISFYERYGVDMRPSGHSSCDDNCEFKNGHNHNINTNTNTTNCNHQWKIERVEANGCENGYECQTCEKCGKKTLYMVLPGDHDMILEKVIAPTCKEQGYEIYKCAKEDCDYQEYLNYIAVDPEAHSLVEVGLPPACFTPGYSEMECEYCGERQGERVVVPATGHTFENGVCINCQAIG